MPNRVLKDSITCSKEIDSLTWFQEVMFYRLIVKADDFGRYYADPQIVKSGLFPTKEDLTKKAVADSLDALEKANLIHRYVWDGSEYLEIVKWKDHQQRRATKSKFPDSKGSHSVSNAGNENHLIANDIKCNQMKSDDSNGNQMSPNTKTNTKAKTKTIGAPLEDDEVLISIQRNHDQLFDVARSIGLQLTDWNMKELVRMFGDYGLEATLHGLTEAGRLNKVSPAYIETVAKNYGKEKPTDDDRLDDSILASCF